MPSFSVLLTRVILPWVVIAIVLAIQFLDPQFRVRIRDNAFDQLQALSPLPYHDNLPVRVIAIDDASLASLGQWPWPRTVIALIIDKLQEMGARAIAFDVIFSEPDRTSPEQIALSFQQNHALSDALLQMPTHDTILAESVRKSRVEIGFPIESRTTNAPLPPVKAHFLSFGGDARDWLPPYGGGLASLPLLTAAEAGSGAISLEPDNDGILRSIPLVYRVRNELYPGLALEALRLFLGVDNLSVQVASPSAMIRGQVAGIAGIEIGNTAFMPTAPDGRLWLHFRPLAQDRYIPAQDLLANKVDARRIKDSIVFIGATAKGLGDTVFSPLGELIPGVEGHVQLTEQMLDGDFLLRPAWENDFVIVLLSGMWLLLWAMLGRLRPVWSVLLTALAATGVLAFSWWLFVAQQLLLDPIFPTLAVGALFIVMMVPRYLQTEREQRWIRNAFSRYVSPNRVKHLQANPQNLELGGVYRECSFVMTDLQGFTTLMEKYEPTQLSSLINDYLDGMIQIAFRHDGTLDRIVGDAVAVMFSAPIVQPDHVERALACALEMDHFAREFSRRQQEIGIPFGKTRIGVNTGMVMVGNFGGKAMLDYRALGDAINTAARLETINAQFGTHICVSGATVAQCPAFTGRPVGRLVLKGKTEAIAVFEPLSAEVMAEDRTVQYLAAYALLEAEAAEAIDMFRQLAERYADDPLVQYHAQRLAAGATGSLIVMSSK